jgi:hypothetical protein
MKNNRIGIALVALILTACNVDAPVAAAPSVPVKKAGAPEIVMSGSSIAFAGNKVQLGQSLASWKKAVPGTPRCSNGKSPPIICTWDQLGLEVGSDDALTNVQFASLFLRVPAVDTEPPPNNPDGTPAAVSTAALPPKLPFSGRLQLDGMAITAATAFAQVRSGIDQSRNVRCGSRDCSGPHGKFGDGAKIFFELDGRSDTDPIARIGLAKVDGK